MRVFRSVISRVGGATLAAGIAVATLAASAQLPMAPIKDFGESITPAYEGWYRMPGGGRALLIGYFNRNLKEDVEIPVGPNNRVEPGGPDMGQPTVFDQRRGWGVFTIPVPEDFGDKKITWTIVSGGKTNAIPMGLHIDYEVEPFKDAAMGNTPPILRFESGGKPFQGPPVGIAKELTATVGQPLELDIFAEDDAHIEPGAAGVQQAKQPPVIVGWFRHRAPGTVTFAEAKPKVDPPKNGVAKTTATFGSPGEYILRAQANDSSGEGGGGFQCCWTNVHVKVVVK